MCHPLDIFESAESRLRELGTQAKRPINNLGKQAKRPIDKINKKCVQ
ncbi:MAG: hypothetical protein RBU37_09685 [Myxococcota bacterium]|nr:hypothetical protein [Myxococcota bacterium]